MFNQENKLINKMKLVALLHGFTSITYLPNMNIWTLLCLNH
jgi:hypothetical protein